MYISHISYYIADNKKTVNELMLDGEMTATESHVFEKMMGLKLIPRDFKSHTQKQLNTVIEKMMNEFVVDCCKVKYVFFAHTADYCTPFNTSVLHEITHQFSFNNALCFGSSVYKCAGTFHQMSLSKKLFQTLSNEDSILLLTADSTFTKMLTVIPGATIMGDASTAILLKKEGLHHQFIDCYMKSLGQFAKGLWGDTNEKLAFQSVYVNTILTIIKKNNLKLGDIKCIFPHNVNLLSWKQIMHALSLNDDKVYLDNVPKTAHCFGSDPFINLKDGIKEGRIVSGDYYLLVTMGLGATFAAMLFQF